MEKGMENPLPRDKTKANRREEAKAAFIFLQNHVDFLWLTGRAWLSVVITAPIPTKLRCPAQGPREAQPE